MINRLKADAQYITTTFKPEQLAHANRIFGVTFANKVSDIAVVSRKTALEFIADEKDV